MLSLRESPVPGGRTEEGLRVAVGLTIANPNLTVLLLESSTALVRESFDWTGRAEMEKHWRTLSELGVRVVAERESLEGPARGAEAWPPARVAALLAEAAVVVSY